MSRIMGLLLALGLVACQNETSVENLCVARLKGRMVSTGPVCAGIAIQVLSGEFDAERVDAAWYNEYSDNPITYKNTFTTYLHSGTGTIDEDLLQLFSSQEEFFFVFTNPEPGILMNENITMCEPLVSLPKTRNEIQLVTQACSDLITQE